MSLCLCGALACSQQPLIGASMSLCLCGALACSHELAFSSFSIINNRSLVPQCLSSSCGALALAANSRSLVVGCCCCLSGVALLLLAATGKALAANSRSLVVGCCCCCLSGVALLWLAATGLLSLPFPIINNRSLVRLNVSLPHVVLLLLLAANSRSLAAGCCLSGVAATGKALAANSHSLAVGCCLSGVAC